MASEFRYVFTKKAEQDLDDIIAYITMALSNPKAAADFMALLKQRISEMCAFPESGAPLQNEFLQNEKIRKKILDNYVLYYLPDEENNRIIILRIVYGRRSLDEIIRELG